MWLLKFAEHHAAILHRPAAIENFVFQICAFTILFSWFSLVFLVSIFGLSILEFGRYQHHPINSILYHLFKFSIFAGSVHRNCVCIYIYKVTYGSTFPLCDFIYDRKLFFSLCKTKNAIIIINIAHYFFN